MSKHTPIHDRAHPSGMGGTQRVYRFPNGYGASVVQFRGSYGFEQGLYELGVIKFEGDDWCLTYDTPITDDVIGHLSPEEVEATLDQIAELPQVETSPTP